MHSHVIEFVFNVTKSGLFVKQAKQKVLKFSFSNVHFLHFQVFSSCFKGFFTESSGFSEFFGLKHTKHVTRLARFDSKQALQTQSSFCLQFSGWISGILLDFNCFFGLKHFVQSSAIILLIKSHFSHFQSDTEFSQDSQIL